MKEYKVKLANSTENCEAVEITCNNWNYPYAPRTTASMVYDAERGLVIRMTCFEKEPFTRYTKNYDPVYTDSCMECFVNLFPEKSADYINLETNSNGAFIFSYGPGRGECRVHLLPKLGISPSVKITKTEDAWIADIIIGNDALHAVYGEFTVEAGHEFIGNFYKCGQDGDNPHYLSWSPIDTEKPDFHCPPYFGKFIVE